MSRDIYNVEWLDLIPPSISGDEQVQAISTAVTPQLQEVSQEIRECILLARIDKLPEPVIDLMAWQWHVDFYEPELTLDQKRALVKTAIDAHRHKGTAYAVELVVKAILNDGVVQEWFEYGGQPYYFRVIKINGQMPDADIYIRLKKAIDTVKNTRSWLEGISLQRGMTGTIYFGGAQSVHKRIDIYPVKFQMPDVSGTMYIGKCVSVHKRIELR